MTAKKPEIVCIGCPRKLTLGNVSRSLRAGSNVRHMLEETAEVLGWTKQSVGWTCDDCKLRFNPDYVSATPLTDRFGRPTLPLRELARRLRGGHACADGQTYAYQMEMQMAADKLDEANSVIASALDALADGCPWAAEVALQAHIDAQGIEAGTDETLQAAQPVGREPDGEADAPNLSQDPTHDR